MSKLYGGRTNTSGRKFKVLAIAHGDRNIWKTRIICHACPYENVLEHIRNGPMEPEEYFLKHHWAVGTNEQGDMCPQCIEDRRLQRRLKGAKDMKEETSSREVKTDKPVRAEEPRRANPTEVRIVLKTIEDHWNDDTNRYESGWSDQRIANDLNVPVQWITSEREHAFGEIGINPDLERYIEMHNDLTRIIGEHDKAMVLLTTSVADVNRLNQEAKDRYDNKIRPKIADLNSLFAKIQREAGQVPAGLKRA